MKVSDYTVEQQRAWFFRALELAALETTPNTGQAAMARDRWLQQAKEEGIDGFVESWRITTDHHAWLRRMAACNNWERWTDGE